MVTTPYQCLKHCTFVDHPDQSCMCTCEKLLNALHKNKRELISRCSSEQPMTDLDEVGLIVGGMLLSMVHTSYLQGTYLCAPGSIFACTAGNGVPNSHHA